jgi:hypothetical protein
MKNIKIKITIDDKIVSAEVKEDLHYLGGKKVVYELDNGVTGHTSYNLVKIVEDLIEDK